MKITVEDISALPKEIAATVSKDQDKYATKVEGGFEVDLASAYDATTSGLRSALSKERATVEAWVKLGKTPDEVRGQIEDLKNSKPKGKGDEEVAAMLSQVEEQYKGKLDAATSQLDKLRHDSASANIKAELSKLGAMPDMVDMVATFAKSRIMFAEDGSMQISTSDGKPMIGSGDNHTPTIADLAADIAKSTPSAFKDGGQGGGGKLPQNGGTPQQSKQIVRSEFDSMTDAQRMTFSKDGGKVVDD